MSRKPELIPGLDEAQTWDARLAQLVSFVEVHDQWPVIPHSPHWAAETGSFTSDKLETDLRLWLNHQRSANRGQAGHKYWTAGRRDRLHAAVAGWDALVLGTGSITRYRCAAAADAKRLAAVRA